MKRTLVFSLLSILFAVSVRGQETDWSATTPSPATPQGKNLDVPQGWQWRLDRPSAEVRIVASDQPDEANIRFVNMTPGWHITTGPAAIFYHPSLSADGTYRAQAEYHLFSPGNRNEAFGMFVGGRRLDADDQSYLYFLIRKSGEYLIKTRNGSETEVVQSWTAHPAIIAYTDETSGTATNLLTIEAHEDTLDFLVNGQKVTSIPRGDLPTEGLVGMRVNHHLNVHVSDLHVSSLD